MWKIYFLLFSLAIQVTVRCRVFYVDSEGLADGRSIKNMVQTLAPKMLVVTGGSRRAKAALVSHVQTQLDGDVNGASSTKASGSGRESGAGEGGVRDKADAPRYVVVQKVGEPLPMGLDSGACDVLLHDSLHTQLKWKQVWKHFTPFGGEGVRGPYATN